MTTYGPSRTGILSFGIVLALIVSIIGFFVLTTRVDAGYICVQTHYGKVTQVLHPGLHYQNPFTSKSTCYSTRLTIYEVSLTSPKDTESKADYPDYPIKSRTSDGIDFDAALSVQYRIDPDTIVNSYQTGFKDMDAVNEKIIKYYTRTIVPQALSNYSADTLYLQDLTTISDAVEAKVDEAVKGKGVIITSFELKRGNFADSYEKAIQSKAVVVEQTKQKILEQDLAKQEAERKRVEAEGSAAAVRITAQGNADATYTQAQADANSSLVKAQAQADGEKAILANRAQVINENPSLITWHQIDLLQSANAIYLPDNVLPLLSLPGTTAPDTTKK